MNFFKAQRVLEADSSCRRRLAESQVFDEEHLPPINLLFLYSFNFIRESYRDREAEEDGECIGAYWRTIMELHLREISHAHLAMLLKISDVVDESMVRMWFGDALRMAQSDNVGGSFFDDEKARDFQGAEDGSFAASGSTAEDVSFGVHVGPHERAES